MPTGAVDKPARQRRGLGQLNLDVIARVQINAELHGPYLAIPQRNGNV